MKTEQDYKFWLEKWGGWIIIFIILLIPTVRWLMLDPDFSRFSSVSGTFKAIGAWAGLIGFLLYAISFVLSTRKRWLENFFGGLNRVYIAHHLVGGLALIFILFHPFFLAIRYIEFSLLTTLKDAGIFLLPRIINFDGSYYEVQEAVAINSGIIALIGMAGLLILTFYIKLPYRIWLFTHKFLGIAFLFAAVHSILVSSDVYSDGFLLFYFILWTLIGFGAFVSRTVFGGLFVRRSPYKVISSYTLPGNVVHIVMDPVNKPIDFKAGQFVFVKFLWSEKDGIIQEIHPFSIASGPSEPNNQIRLYVKALGDFTSTLKRLQPGTIVEVEGAFGKFIPSRYTDQPQIWVGGGIGITPLLSAARNFSPNHPPVDLYYSVQTRTEMVDQEALAEFLPKYYKQFRYFPYVFEETKTYLNARYIEEKSGGLKDKHIFICGPPPMMKSLRSQFRQLGVPNEKIHTEEFSMS